MPNLIYKPQHFKSSFTYSQLTWSLSSAEIHNNGSITALLGGEDGHGSGCGKNKIGSRRQLCDLWFHEDDEDGRWREEEDDVSSECIRVLIF